MNSSNWKFIRLILALCFVGLVGVGTDEALANLSEGPSCTFEDEIYCLEGCQAAYGENYWGGCEPWYETKICACWGPH
jgi:hypothetical protein